MSCHDACKDYHPSQPIVQDLVKLIDHNGWGSDFEKAIHHAHEQVAEMGDIDCLPKYLKFLNDLLFWVPTENISGKDIYIHLCKFYFVIDQHPINTKQNAIKPAEVDKRLTDLSEWLVKYAIELGKFLDTPESITEASLASFKDSPNYNMDDYIIPRGGFRTFNELFARNFKPGYRPVAAIADPTVIVSPADSTYGGQWEIRSDSGVTIKNLHWQIKDLLKGSQYADRFNNGIFMHAFLGPNDYHRQHAPVGGTVLEARVIPGQVYLEVVAEKDPDPEKKGYLRLRRVLDAPDNAGYQFLQARGLLVLDTAIGLVAVLPIGMAQVSSVIVTAEVGKTLRKGEELSYFQFGGSDIILVFQAKSNVSLTAQLNTHYKMGNRIGVAYPEV